jgi:YVTN family beta-propeller protein
MNRYFCRSFLLLAIPLAASSARIYVANSAGDTVDVIDPVTNKVVQVIDTMERPHGIGFSPNASRVYISNEGDRSLSVVDRKTGKTMKKVPLSGRPNLFIVTKDGKRIIVCISENPPHAGLDIVDTTSLERVKTIPTKG